MTTTGRRVEWRPETQRFTGTWAQHFQQVRCAQQTLDADYAALEARVLAAGGTVYRIQDEVIIEMHAGAIT